jgi:hypothetical protein
VKPHAEVALRHILYDLGCGDGRIVITAESLMPSMLCLTVARRTLSVRRIRRAPIAAKVHDLHFKAAIVALTERLILCVGL